MTPIVRVSMMALLGALVAGPAQGLAAKLAGSSGERSQNITSADEGRAVAFGRWASCARSLHPGERYGVSDVVGRSGDHRASGNFWRI